jgi:hypothetical protein
MNYNPCHVSGISTTPHELVYGIKPDLRVLFHPFSTGYLRHSRDGSHHRSGISEACSFQGIALGRCRKSDGMIFYSLHTKELYISSDYKLDGGRHTPNAFNWHYDGGIFIGLYNHKSPTTFEPFPQGTSVSFPVPSKNSSSSSIRMRGVFISVPIPKSSSSIPVSDNTVSPYVIQLIDGSFYPVSPDVMNDIVTTLVTPLFKVQFPSWLGNNQKVMYLSQGMYVKGIME